MYYFIVNPASKTGMGRKIWERVEKELKARHVDYIVHFTEYAFHSKKIAKEICSADSTQKYIIVLGGDGTANEVINSIPSFENIIFGYIPSGSANDLARGMGVPADPMTALSHILSGEYIKAVDHGQICSSFGDAPHRFAVSAGIGFDAAICHEALDSPVKTFLNKIHLGKFTYLVIALKQLFSYRQCNLSVLVDGKVRHDYKRVFFLAAMNGCYEGGGLKMAPDADPSDGKLTVCVIHDFPKIKAAIVLPALLFGLHTHFKGIDIYNCSKIEISSNRKLYIHSDGEYCGQLDHTTFSILEQKVYMVV